MTASPDFSKFTSTEIVQYKTNKIYRLYPANKIPNTSEMHQQIKDCCNEKSIFKWIFEDICPNGYPIESAVDFLEISKKGWTDNSHFIFSVLSDQGDYAGSLDLKSSNLKLCEVGCWFSENHTGVATNALSALINIAKQAGYLHLFAQTRPGNDRSIRLLERIGFKENTKHLKLNSRCTKAFSLLLT